LLLVCFGLNVTILFQLQVADKRIYSNSRLHKKFILERRNRLCFCDFSLNNFAWLWLGWQSLVETCFDAFGLGRLLGSLVGLDTVQKILLTPRGLDVLNTHVNPLLDDSVANLLVDLNTNGTRSHIPDHSSSPMVESERHALVDGGIGLDVHIIADFVGSEVFREGHWSMLSEGLCKEFPRPSPITKGVRHLCVEVAMNYRGEELASSFLSLPPWISRSESS